MLGSAYPHQSIQVLRIVAVICLFGVLFSIVRAFLE